MIGLGFRPFQAAVLNLIANTAPVAWGAIGTPVHTLAAVSGLPEGDLNKMIASIHLGRPKTLPARAERKVSQPMLRETCTARKSARRL